MNPSSTKACGLPLRIPEEDEYNGLIKQTMLYIKRNCGSPYDERDFIKTLKFNEVRTSVHKATKQLESFLRLYFPETPMCKSLPKKTIRYTPYRPIQHHVEPIADTAAEDSISSTPPSSTLRRAGSFTTTMDLDAASQLGGNNPAAAAMNLTVRLNLFNGVPPASHQQPTTPSAELVSVRVILPDDYKTSVRISPQATVTDLRFELRKALLLRYPAKRIEDVPLDKLVLKTKMGWSLNLADRVSEVVQEDTIVHCHYVD